MDDDDAADTSLIDDSRPTPTIVPAPSVDNVAIKPAPVALQTTPGNAPPSQIPTVDAPPAQPPRPLTETQRNENTLKEAFPDIDIVVLRAILSASQGNMERAVNALLG